MPKTDRRVCRINKNELGWIEIPKGKVNVLSSRAVSAWGLWGLGGTFFKEPFINNCLPVLFLATFSLVWKSVQLNSNNNYKL